MLKNESYWKLQLLSFDMKLICYLKEQLLTPGPKENGPEGAAGEANWGPGDLQDENAEELFNDTVEEIEEIPKHTV